ncbi:MAG: hypothetical protein ABI867_03835 [Kofleriaceae bacterium]
MTEDRKLPAWLASAGIAAALAGFVVFSFAQRWALLSASPFPLGVDGYFYPVQLRGLLESGELHYAASPLAFWLLAPFAAATDPIIGAKLGASVYGALIAVPAYGVGVHLGRGRGPGLVASAIATFSAGSFYLTIEFVKNGIGLTVALTALWLVLRALTSPTRPRIVLALIAILAALLAHKMAAGLIVAIAIPATVAEATARTRLRGRRLLEVLGVLALAVIVLVILGLVAPQRFLSPTDLALLGDAFSGEADWSLPASRTLRLGHEPLLAAIAAVLAAIALVVDRHRRPARLAAVSWVAVGLALVIAIPWLAVTDSQGLAMRLRIVAFVPLALCVAIALGSALRLLPKPGPAVACTVLAAIAALRVSGDRREGVVEMHPALVAGALALPALPPDTTVVIPERHLVFMVAWYARVPVSLRPDDLPVDRRVRLLPGAFVELGSPLDDALLAIRARTELPPVIGLHPYHPNGFVLVPEVTWQIVLGRLPPSERGRLAAWPVR